MRTVTLTEEQRCDNLVKSLGGSLYAFSLKGRSPVPDVPDRRYRVRGVALWVEIKVGPQTYSRKDTTRGERTTKGDQLTQGQLDFLTAEYEAGQIVFAGDHDALSLLLTASPPSQWRELGWTNVTNIAARGLRSGNSTSRKPTRKHAPAQANRKERPR